MITKLGTWDGGKTWVFRIRDPDAIQFTGGSIYKVSSGGFTYNPHAGLGPNEWMSTTPVRVLGEERWDSGLEAMQHYGVQIRWPLDQALVIKMLREHLQAEGFLVSPWKVVISSVDSEWDLLVLRRGSQSVHRLVYDSSEVLAVLEVEGIGPFDKRGPKRIRARFDKVRSLNRNIFCAYVLGLKRETHIRRKVSDDILGYPGYNLSWHKDSQREVTLMPSNEWKRLLHDLSSNRTCRC